MVDGRAGRAEYNRTMFSGTETCFFYSVKGAQMERDKDQKKILEYGMELSYLAALKASSLVSDAEYSVILEAINDAYSGCIKKVKGNGEKNEIE